MRCRRDDRSSRALRRGSEQGFTLVEVLIATTILSLSVVVIVAAMTSTVTVSDRTSRKAIAESEARRLAELVRSSQTAFSRCPGAPDGTDGTHKSFYKAKLDEKLDQQGVRLADGFIYDVTKVEYEPLFNGTWSTATCGGTSTDFHRITIAVTSTAQPTVTATIAVIKRDTTYG